MADPSTTIPSIGAAPSPNSDLPASEFPSLQRIQPTDLVGTTASNRQHASEEKRTETLRVAANLLIEVVNQLDSWFLRRDGSAQKDGHAGATADIPMDGHTLAGLRAAAAAGEPIRYEEFQALAALVGGVSSTPVGMIGAFASVQPAGWLICDGTLYTTTGYVRDDGVTVAYPGTPGSLSWAALTNLRGYLNNTWGGDGVNSFRVPDYRGRVILGAGVGRNGQIVRVRVTSQGSGYTSVPTVTIAPPPSGGIQATAVANVYLGKVVSIRIVNPGSGYTTAVSVSFSGGAGTGAAAATDVVLTSRSIGSYGGEETHQQTVEEMPYHGHPTGNESRAQGGNDNYTVYGIKRDGNVDTKNPTGDGQPFNVMPPWATANVCIKY